MRGTAIGIAPAQIADRGKVDSRSEMAANNILAVLPVTFRPADAARVQRRAPAVGLLDDHETQRLSAGVYRVKMHVAVLNSNFADGHTYDASGGFDGANRGRRGVRARVNEIGGERHDHGQGRACPWNHPPAH